MRSESAADETSRVDADQQARDYEAPSIAVLGTFAELTQLGSGATDELLNDGSQV